MKKMNKNIFICALLVLMLVFCINTASADDTLNQNLTSSDVTPVVTSEVSEPLSADDTVSAVSSDASEDVLSAEGDTLIVDSNGGSGTYTSISAAVSAASGGETILIKNGEYSESGKISLTKSLNFVGESKDGVKITSSATNQGIFEMTSSGVVLSFVNLTFSNVNSGTGSNLVMKIGGDSNVDIIGCSFVDCSGKFGAIQLYTTGTATIDDCKIENFKSATSGGTTGIYISGNGVYEIKNTVINNSQYVGASGYSWGVLYVNAKTADTTLTNVTISNTKGAASSVICAKAKVKIVDSRIVNNTIEKSATGYQGESVLYSFYNANNPNGELIIEQSVIADNVAPNAFIYANNANAKTTINYCNIHDNTYSTFVTTSATDLEANYWGSNDLPGGVTATTWAVENNGAYELNNGNPLEKTIPELDDGSDEPSLEGAIYVSTTGDDSNDGLSEETAVATLKHAIEIATDKIVILSGEYTQTQFLNITKDLAIIGKGDVTIKANVAERVAYEEWDDWDEELVTKYKTVNTMIENNANLNISNIKFTLVPASISQEFILNNANLLVNICEFSNIKITSSRGVIQNVLKAKLEVNGTTFKTASGTYGAINNNGELLVNNSKFQDNDRSKDSGIYSTAITSYNKANIYNSLFEGNKGTAGGAVYVMYSYTIRVNPIMVIENCTFENNVAVGSSVTSGSGSAIKSSGNQVTLTVSNSTFIKNSVSGASSANGGAIFATGTTTIDSCVFVDNSASSGKSVYSDGETTITNSIILDSNVAVAKSSSGTVTANDNWWGSNDKPTNIASGVTVDTWIIATASANPSEIETNSPSTVTVDFHQNTDGTTNTTLSKTIPDYLIVKFTADGSVSPESVSVKNGQATATYTSDVEREDTIHITSENKEIATVKINVSKPYDGPIYVSTTGASDDNSGKEDSPVATIAKAIELAASGSGKIIIKEGTYTIDATLKVDNDLDITGEGNVVINGNSIKIMENNANLNLYNIKFTGGSASDACVLLNKGNATLDGCEVYSNSFSGSTNTIIRNNALGNTLVINNSKFHDNFAGYGNIYNNKGKVIINNSEFSDNDMSTAGVPYGAILYSPAGEVILENTKVKNNKGRKLIYTKSDGFGVNAVQCELTVKNCTFESNTAVGTDAGVLYLENTKASISDSKFTENVAQPGEYTGGHGGAIYSQGSTTTIDSTVFNNNKASEGGNDIYMYSGTLNMANSVLLNKNGISLDKGSMSSTIDVNNNFWGDNTKANVGSGIAVDTWIILSAEYTPEEVSNGDEVTITATFDKTNSSSGVSDYNGKIADGLEVSFSSTSGDIATATTKDGAASVKYTIKDADEEFTITSSNAQVVLPINKVAPSGIIYVSTTGDDSKDGLSEENAVATLEHAIEIATGKIIILEGTYSFNGLTVDKDLDISANGNVVIDGSASKIITNNANLNLTGISFTNGLMSTGSTANLKCVIYNGGNLTINDCVFYNNKVTTGSSSVIYNDKGIMTVNNSEFYGNGAANGVVYNSYGTLLVNNSYFHDNSAEYSISYGTAINNANGIATIANSNFTKNNGRYGTVTTRTTYNSGASASSTIENCIFTENVAGNFGGAVDIEAVNPGRASANIKNCTFIDNTAKAASTSGTPYGGAAYIFCADVDIDQSVFINNKAVSSIGQDIYASNAEVTVKDSIILNDNGNSIEIAASSLDSTTVTANDNWWGSNDKPTNVGNGVTVDTWVKMDASLTPSQVKAGDEVTVTATFDNDKLPNNVINVTFTSTSGNLNEKVLVNNGKAEVTYTIDANDKEITVTSTNAEVVLPIEDSSESGVIYVSPTGDDSKDGLSEANAVKTIAHAIEIADEGKIILLEGIHVIDAILMPNKDLDITGKGNVIIDGNKKRIIQTSAGLNLTNIQFTNGYSKTSNLINIASGGTYLNLNNIKFYNNIAKYGVAAQTGTKLVINNSEFYDNDFTSATNSNGVVYIASADAIIENSLFNNNKGKVASAIAVNRAGSATTGSLKMNNVTISNNFANVGNGILGVTGTNTVVEVNNSKFLNNFVNVSASNVGGYGGAIYMAATQGSLTVDQSVFINNTGNNPNSLDNGIYANKGTVSITNSILLGNATSENCLVNDGATKVTAENNWWGNNDKANTNVQVDKIVKMNAVLTPEDAKAGDEVTITVTFDNDKLPNNVINVTFTSTSGSLNQVITMESNQASITYAGDKNDNAISVISSDAEVILPFDVDSGKIFVKPGAPDTNPGTRDAPVGTIKHALEICNGEIVLLEGTHFTDYLGIISDDLTITGEGKAVIDAQNSNRILYVGSEANVVINNVTMVNGYIDGEEGALLGNSNNLTLINCILANSTAGQYGGGAIYTIGKLTVINTTIANCSARTGGAIWTKDSLAKGNTIEIINSTIENNYASGNENNGGGAIFAQQIVGLTIENTTFINNRAGTTSSGGAIFISHSDADIKITDSKFIANHANGQGSVGGGAIYRVGTDNYQRHGTMTITGTLFENNTCDANGAAIYARSTTVTVSQSVLLNNKDANGLAVYGYKTEQVSPAITLNDNWWGSNDSPKDLVGGNGYKPTLTRWAILTVENASEIKEGESVTLTVSINKYTDGTNNGTMAKPILVPRNVTIATNLDSSSSVLENGELTTDLNVPNGVRYITVTVDDETVVLFTVTSDTNVEIDDIVGKKYDKVEVIINVTSKDGSEINQGNVELFVDGVSVAVIPVSGGKAITDLVISQNDGSYNLTAKFVDEMGLFADNEKNATLTVSGICELVNSTFFNFFDEEGNLRDEIAEDELVFHGEFSDLGVNVITINKPISVKGDNAVIYDMAFNLLADGIKLNDFKLIADGTEFDNSKNAAIFTENDNVEVTNVSVEYNAPSDASAYAVYAEGAEGFKLINSTIAFEANNMDNNNVNQYALHLFSADNAEIKGNNITAVLPAKDLVWNANGIYVDLIAGVAIQDGENSVLTENVITVDTKSASGNYPTIDTIIVNGASNLEISKNNITQTDFSGENKAGYSNAIDLYNFKGITVKDNNVLVNTTTGVNGAGTAYPVQASGPYSGLVVDNNNLTAVGRGPVLGIYSQNYDGATDIVITNNTINVTGFASANEYALVSGMELQDSKAKVYNNTIYSHSINGYSDDYNIYGISLAQDTSVDHIYDVQNNTVYTDGKYAVYFNKASDSIIKYNTLYANELLGDAAATATGNGNIIENNYPVLCTNITVDVDNVYEGQPITVTVNVPGMEGTVTIRINGNNYTVDLVDGVATYDIDDYGDDRIVNATFDGNAKYLSNWNVTDFEVLSYDMPSLNITVGNITVGEDAVINVSVDPNAEGLITVNVNGKVYDVEINGGKGSITVSNLTASDYVATVTYRDLSGHYASGENSTVFNVAKAKSNLTIEVPEDIAVGDNVNVTIAIPNATGSVSVIVDGKSQNVDLVDGKANVTIENITAGTHTIVAIYNGDKNNDFAYNTTTFTVDKKSTEISLDIVNVTVGNSTVVVANIDAVGNVTFIVDGVESSVAIVDGVASLELLNVTSGNHTVNVIFAENDRYLGSSASGVLGVDKLNATLDAVADPVSVGDDAVITITVPDDATGYVVVENGDKKYYADIDAGKATVTVPGLSENTTLTVSYSGDDKYNANITDVNVTVEKVSDYNMSINSSSEDGKTTVDVELPKDATGNVTVTDKDGNNYTVPVKDGKASVDVSDLPEGENNLTVNYSGDDKYAPKSDETSVNKTNEVKDTVLSGDKLEMYSGDGSKFTVVLKDKNGKPIAGKTILVHIVGKTYHPVTDANGVAVLPINLNPNSYQVSAEFAGDDEYKASNTISTTVEVYTKVRIDKDADLVKDYLDASKPFKVRALDKYGKPVGAGEVVKMTVAGKTYSVKTDANGYASLPINLNPKTWDITAEYGGYKVTHKITVKQVLSASAASYKKASTYKYTATLKSSAGKGISGKTVKFTINGKTYTATTNANGVATINIKQALNVGKYTILCTYEGTSVSKTITIK